MTHLVIQQKKVLEGGSRESVTSAFIKKLYDYTNDANLVYQSTDLKGDLSVDKTYQKYIDYLTTKYPGLDIQATSTYIYFGDNAVESYWANTAYGDGIGITSSSAATITKIGNSPFYNNTNITNLDGMQYFINCTDIGARFAREATNLTSFVAPPNLLVLSDPYDSDPAFMGAFRGCASLSHVVLNEGLQKITCSAFQSCTSLQTIDIPSTVTHLATNDSITKGSYGVFAGCTSLTTVTGGEGIVKMGSSIFSGCSSLRSLPDMNFSQMTYIGEACFYDCPVLELGAISLPNITRLRNSTFCNCAGLTSLNIPNVTQIDSNADWRGIGVCKNCTGLTTVTAGSLQTVGGYAFHNCTSLTSIDISNITSIGQYAFCNVPINIELNLTNLTGTVPIGAFYNTGITKIKSLGNITSIESSNNAVSSGAFRDCLSLTEVDLSTTNNLTVIGTTTFTGCTALTTVKLPASLTEIKDQAFYVAPTTMQSRTYYIYATTPPTISTNSISGIINGSHTLPAAIYVPYGCGTTYQNANIWSDYASVIHEMSQS